MGEGKNTGAEGELGEKKKGELSNTARILTSLAAGGIAGGCAKTVIAPFICLQNRKVKDVESHFSLYILW